jgi:hypothetical protein
MYQGKLDKNHKDKNTSLTVRNILDMQGVAEMLLCIKKILQRNTFESSGASG